VQLVQECIGGTLQNADPEKITLMQILVTTVWGVKSVQECIGSITSHGYDPENQNLAK
jgi:hypothetical protein